MTPVVTCTSLAAYSGSVPCSVSGMLGFCSLFQPLQIQTLNESHLTLHWSRRLKQMTILKMVLIVTIVVMVIIANLCIIAFILIILIILIIFY